MDYSDLISTVSSIALDRTSDHTVVARSHSIVGLWTHNATFLLCCASLCVVAGIRYSMLVTVSAPIPKLGADTQYRYIILSLKCLSHQYQYQYRAFVIDKNRCRVSVLSLWRPTVFISLLKWPWKHCKNRKQLFYDLLTINTLFLGWN